MPIRSPGSIRLPKPSAGHFDKAVDAKTGKELYKFKTPSGIIGNVTTYEQGGRQYVAVLSAGGGWAGIGLAAGLLTRKSSRRVDPLHAPARCGLENRGYALAYNLFRGCHDSRPGIWRGRLP